MFRHHVEADEMKFIAGVLPWVQLTHILITDFISVNTFVDVLSECHAVQFIRVSLILVSVDEEPANASFIRSSTSVTLSSLSAMHILVDGRTSFPSAMNIFHFPTLTALRFRRFWDDPAEIDQFSWILSGHFCSQLGQLQRLNLTGHVGSTEEVISLLRCTPAVTKLTLDIFIEYQTLIPVLFPSYTTTLLPSLVELELNLEDQEMSLPKGSDDTFEITRGGITQHRLHNIAFESSQPCLFRFHKMIESAQPRILLHLHVLKLVPFRGPARLREKTLLELRNQFSTSALTTHFGGKDVSLRIDSDQNLLEIGCPSTSYTLS
jgi:hypothetical protein